MDDRGAIREFIHIVPFSPNAKDRIHNEMVRMKDDMEILLTSWTIKEIKAMFGEAKNINLQPASLQGEQFADQCRNLVRSGGFTYLTDACYLADFEKAEQLRISKLKLFTRLISRDQFFRYDKNKGNAEADNNGGEENVTEIFDFIGLPNDLIAQILQRTNYKDAQSLASTCRLTNAIYQKDCTHMILPNIALVLDFSSGELNARWILDSEESHATDNPDKNLLENRENEKKKRQLFNNATLLKIETSGQFQPEDIGAVRNFIGNRIFPRVVVKGNEYNLSLRMMVEQFDKETVELHVNSLPVEDLPFPDIKTISVRNTLTKSHGLRIFNSKQFINISCALTDIDTLRRALGEWDSGEREIGRWVILKQFTVFQTPFGRRNRPEDAQRKGCLTFLSELDSSQMLHGEITEYVFEPAADE